MQNGQVEKLNCGTKDRIGLKPHSDLVWLWTSSVGLSFLIYKMRGLDSELKVKCSFIWHTGVLLKDFTQKLDYGKRCLVILHFLPKALCTVFSERLSLLRFHLLHYFALWFCLSLASRWYLQENWLLNEIEREVFFFLPYSFLLWCAGSTSPASMGHICSLCPLRPTNGDSFPRH